MTAAVIDIGSNSVLLLVGRLTVAGSLRISDRGLTTTRLGEGLAPGGALAPAAKDRTRRAVEAFVQRAHEGGARAVVAFATGAARRAHDGAAYVQALATTIGIPIEIVRGDDEAILAYRAACPLAAGPCAVVDVGGATTEITLGNGANIEQQTSLPLGALSLTEAFTESAAGATLDRPRLVAAIDAILAPVAILARLRARRVPLLASGGTATALAALDLNLATYDPEPIHGYRLSHDAVERFAAAGGSVPPAVDPRRAEILPAGALVLRAVMQAAGVTMVTVSDHGVSYAYLEQYCRSHPVVGAAS